VGLDFQLRRHTDGCRNGDGETKERVNDESAGERRPSWEKMLGQTQRLHPIAASSCLEGWGSRPRQDRRR
jgi:hypothetical protein